MEKHEEKCFASMLPKPGEDPKSAINHGPIIFLNTLSKVFERLLLVRLNIHLALKSGTNSLASGAIIAQRFNLKDSLMAL